ncbi:hypothetical protein EI94DRAFT_1242886 [Lactarius quietus]|nr:hypothetical protein EI94DRAFT_1242886 [Lactarius quietus]
MRLVRRDKGCVVCHSPYTYSDDWSYFHGAHIFPFAMQGLWSTLKLSDDIRDPYTAASANNQICSKHDPLRINSLENGLLFCLFHHKAYHNFRFTIHPVSHKIFAFHPAMAAFDGQDVVAPWCNPNSANYPPPSAKLLRIHFEAAISVSCRVAAEVAEDDSDDSDDESDVSDRVRFWVEDSWQGEEYLDPQTVAGYEGAPPVGTG